MCNIFSGLIVTKKGKDWGKVLFLSGVHHEKDREQIKEKYGDETLAWESTEKYSLTEFKFTHTINVNKKEQKELMKILKAWVKKQDKEKLLRSMITVLDKNNKPTQDYKIFDNTVHIGDNMTLICDWGVDVVAGDGANITAGYGANITAGHGANITTEDNANITARDNAKITAGDDAKITAGYDANITAGNNSCMIVRYWDGKIRYKVGYIGEDGLKPNVKYKLNDKHEFEEVKE